MGRSDVFTAALALTAVALLCLLLLMITCTPPQPVAAGWELPGNGSVDYMFIGGNDTLYAFRGNDVAAIRSDGSIAWTYTVPGEWSVLNNLSDGSYSLQSRPVAAEADGYLYLFTVRHITQEERDSINSGISPFYSGFDRAAKIMAIAPDGKVAGEYAFTIGTPHNAVLSLLYDDTAMPYTIALAARKDRIYLFADYMEHIIDRDLRTAQTINDVASPPAIDEDGRIYLVRTAYIRSAGDTEGVPPDAVLTQPIYRYYGGMLPTGTVEAYSPDRIQLWSRYIGYTAVGPEIWETVLEKFNTLPLYAIGTLYVPIADGAVALDRDGNVKWECHLPENDTYSLYEMMPVDERGNVYVRSLGVASRDTYGVAGNLGSNFYTPQIQNNYLYSHEVQNPRYLYVISPGGTYSRLEWNYGNPGVIISQSIAPIPMAAENGMIYVVNSTGAMDEGTFDWMAKEGRLNPDRLTALDADSGAEIWNFTVPARDKRVVRLNANNLNEALPGFTQETVDDIKATETERGWRPDLPLCFYGYDGHIDVYPGGNVTYLNYYFATYESPIIYGQSRCIYARSLYAIDGNGSMLWKKPIAGLVTAMAANNSTFFYGTNDGRIGTVTGNAMVAGIALAASLYLFFRFFLLGTISRAKTKLNKNENRNTVLQYILDNPGVTAVDVSKALKMNLGTTRYHLFILTANHRIITHKEDSKFLRYFTNAGTYSEKERSLLSLMRREPLKRILKTLAERPGLSNLELARELNVSTAAVHDNVNELYRKGIVNKDAQGDRGYAYAIKEEYCPYIAKTMERL